MFVTFEMQNERGMCHNVLVEMFAVVNSSTSLGKMQLLKFSNKNRVFFLETDRQGALANPVLQMKAIGHGREYHWDSLTAMMVQQDTLLDQEWDESVELMAGSNPLVVEHFDKYEVHLISIH